MRIGDRIAALFRAAPAVDPVAVEGEVGWSESLVYGGSSFPKYNPDDLLTRKGYGIYRTMMTDEQIKAVVRFKRDAITSRDWFFECDHEGLSEEARDERIAFFKACVCGIAGSWLDVLNGMMSALYHGFSLTEKVLEPGDYAGAARIMLARLRLRPFDTIYFHTDVHGNVERIVQKLDGKEQDLDPTKFVHYVQSPDYDEHYGSSELREAYRAWFSKDITIRMQNIYLERMAAGFVWVAPQAGRTLAENSAEYRALQRVLTNISSKTAMILPSGLELHVEHPHSTDAFERAIAGHDKSIAKALLVPNLLGISEQGQTGSYSQSQTQLEAFLWTLNADATRLEEVLNEQLFRELGDLNYGDGMYPRFKFKPVSDAKKMEIIRLWKDLVQAGAAQSTSTDEAHVRELLDVPQKAVVEGAEDENDVTLNGAQVSSIIDIAARVGKGEISQDAAVAVLLVSFPLTEEQARKIVATEVKPKPAQLPPGTMPGQLPGAMPDAEGDPKNDELPDETIVGTGLLKTSKCGHKHGPLLSSQASFTKAMKRVEFAVIGSKSEDSAEQSAYDVASANGDAVARIISEAEGVTLEGVAGLKFSSAELAAMKKVVMAGISDGWKIGSQHAQKELRKADKERFSREYFDAGNASVRDQATKWIAAESHQITGSISQQTQATIQNTLITGIKTGKAFSDTKKEIYKALESEGLLTEEDIEAALGTKTVKDTKARINTIMRTATFEAINESRLAYFSDPELQGFVEALEYSAILDDLTTDICSRLDGKTFAMNSEEWQTFNPPNHFNCRSLLIPITTKDNWTPSETPDVKPQKGFGFDRVPYDAGPAQITFSPIINISQPATFRQNDQPNITFEAIMPDYPKHETVVNVAAPNVSVSPQITVSPADVNIEMPTRRTDTTITRNGQGDIVSTVQIEKNV